MELFFQVPEWEEERADSLFDWALENGVPEETARAVAYGTPDKCQADEFLFLTR